jgi:uncharacterized membrane protein YdjX (TVP38/TMEM64 family)
MTETDPAVPAPPRSLLGARLGAVAAVAIMLFVAHRAGIFDQLSAPERVRVTLLGLGPWGYVAFVAAYATLQPFGLPGTVFVFAAPLIWPWPVAFALSMLGTMAASVVGFSFARFVARDWVARYVPARFRKYDDALARRALATVVTLRFVFWMPPLLHAFFGVSKVRFWTHFWGSLVGYVVPLLVVSYFGERVFDEVRTWPAEAWAGVGAGILLLVASAWVMRRRRRASAV